MTSLPLVQVDHSIKEICESVAEGNISATDGIGHLEKRLAPILSDHKDLNKITVLAILAVEQLVPTSQGVFISLEDLDQLWNNPKEEHEKEPCVQMSFLVMSCMQLTTVGPVRNGAKAMGQILDRMLPEQLPDELPDQLSDNSPEEPPAEVDLN